MRYCQSASRVICVAAVLVAVGAEIARAEILYVDNRRGSDSADGRSAVPQGEEVGPTRTISRALRLAGKGDTVIVRNTGRTYYEALHLVGGRNSGFSNLPFTLIGNGVVVDGSRRVPAGAWNFVGAGIWKMTPWRKGHYQLLLKGKPLPEFRPKTRPKQRPAFPQGQWTVWKGSIYLHTAVGERPGEKPYRFAFHSVGVTLYNVRDVQILDFTFQHFRLDGVNAHDLCSRVLLEKLTIHGNGRSGIAVGGSSAVLVRNCPVGINRIHSVLISELGGVKFEDSKLSKPPTLQER
ncbi:MAG: right-handed parallel beta-helix repeat-containing protein [Planctomycetes bacterium]|nr:right-handed parallel beta-helix repeat-containing protein [Planctomycetota bacterium]